MNAQNRALVNTIYDMKEQHTTAIKVARASMSRRHFKALAESLKNTQATQTTCEAVALYLSTTNPRFDMDKFLSACGVR